MDVIDSCKIDPGFKYQIAKEDGGEGILKCFACGACTARCPEMDVKPEWNARVIIRKAVLGLKEEVLYSEFYWICSAHYRFLEKCPQKVNVKEVMNVVRDARLLEEQTEDATGKKTKKYLDLDFKYKSHRMKQEKVSTSVSHAGRVPQAVLSGSLTHCIPHAK